MTIALPSGGVLQPATAGVVCAVVGFTSSFPVVLTGLRAVGASDAQAASGLAVLCLTMGLGCVLFSWRSRTPITIVWSTPGAALLATAVAPRGGFGVAVGAFCVTGLLLALTGLVPWMSRLVRAIPTSIANAMLAGVLLPLCLALPPRQGQRWVLPPGDCLRLRASWWPPQEWLPSASVPRSGVWWPGCSSISGW